VFLGGFGVFWGVFSGFLSCDFAGGVSCDFAQCFGCVLIGVLLADICLKFCQQLNNQHTHVAKNEHLQFSHPQNSHDDITGALALAVAHSMQTPPPGVGAAMLSHSEKAKPLYSTRFLQL
jgi:hypothetical protein